MSVMAMFLRCIVRGDRLSQNRMIGDVLDDNVLSTADKTETLALDDTSATDTNDRLVGANGNTENTSVVARRVQVSERCSIKII